MSSLKQAAGQVDISSRNLWSNRSRRTTLVQTIGAHQAAFKESSSPMNGTHEQSFRLDWLVGDRQQRRRQSAQSETGESVDNPDTSRRVKVERLRLKFIRADVVGAP